MNSFQTVLAQRLADLREQGLHRELREVKGAQSTHIETRGKTLLNFSSNDYLGLANDPIIKAAAIKATENFGAGSGASRLICGSLSPFHELEQALAAFKRTEAALSFSTGYIASLSAICTLMSKDDVIVLDKLVHASIVDAARLSGAKIRVFAHNDLENLDDLLEWSVSPERTGKTLVVIESVYSMGGDQAPLREIVNLKDKYGAWLMVDEAHATGIFGPNRRGLAEELGVSANIDIQMGTLGKALGASGGFICGSRNLIDYLVNRARPFIFSTAPVPAAAGAALAALNFVQSTAGKTRCAELWERVSQLNAKLHIHDPKRQSPILPYVLGKESLAVETAAALRERGIYIPAIRYPSVPRGRAQLRITLTASHTAHDVQLLSETLEQLSVSPLATDDAKINSHNEPAALS